MTIEIKSCRMCPFINTETSFGEVMWECSRGAFGLSSTPPEKGKVHMCCPLLKEDIVIKHATTEGLTKQQYEVLVKGNEEASRNNDYSKMIIMGSDTAKKMDKYKQDNICKHPDVGTDGGGDYCKSCGKRW